MQIQPQTGSIGALVHGVDLSKPQTAGQIAALRACWLEHKVLAFPDQALSIEALERFATTIGPFGVDPYFESIPGHSHVAEIRREADETTPLFAESWHSDWSFLAAPPAATVLYGSIIPPIGGDTLFADQYAAWDALPAATQVALKERRGVHSARRGYSRAGLYGEKDRGRSMAIKYSDDALATQLHPIARVHPETGRIALFVNMGYTIGIEGMSDAEAAPLLAELFAHQVKPEFVYRHRWTPQMLVLWDNRCVIHAATGGYQGHRRLLQRVTVADRSVQ